MASQSRVEHCLSFGALRRILNGEKLENVVLQILGFKQIPGRNNNRFRLLLNDGVVLFPYAILATQLNNLIYENQLNKFTIFKLKDYQYSQLLANKKVIICINIEILVPGSEVNEKISESDCNNTQYLSGKEAFTPVPSTSTVTFSPRPNASYGQSWDTAPSSTDERYPSKTRENAEFSTIASLSPYRYKWSIKACLSYKSPIYNYCNGQKQGKYFAFHLLDDSGEIRAVAFNEDVEKYYEVLEIFKIYIVSNANIKPSLENSPVKCDFEMTIDNRTKIEFYADNEPSVPKPVFNFKTISSLNSLPKDSSVDVIGICYKISDVSNIATKYKEMPKRIISLIDKSKKSINVTLWGAHAENFSIAVNSVVVIKNAKLSSFYGCSLSVTSMSSVYINPHFHKTSELKTWFQTVGSLLTPAVTSDSDEQTASQNWKTLADIFNYQNNGTNIPIYHTTKATIVMVKKECMYQACPFLGCAKKVYSLNGKYKCDRCLIEHSTFRWAYLLVFQIADFTGSQWVTTFGETAESLFDMDACTLDQIRGENYDRYLDILNNLNLKSYIFKLRSNFETYNDDTRLKTSVLSYSSVNSILYTTKLLNDIKSMSRLLYNQ